MADDTAIKVSGVFKTFKLPHERNSSIKSALINFHKRKKGYEKQEVLKDISFEVKKGDFFGIVGRNGSGKSTLLKLLAGIYSPDSGDIQVNGKLTPFIELGVGFNPELSGRENVFLNGALLGFNRKEMNAMYDDIVAFAELERFMDQKLKNYSSGMQVRLAFSIAIRAESDILVLDEVLAVGDAIFQQKCFKYFGQLKSQNKTILLVSHDISVLRQYCTNAILIEKGNIIAEGNIDEVADKYIDVISAQEAKPSKGSVKSSNKHHGTGLAKVKSVNLTDAKGVTKKHFTELNDSIFIKVTYYAVSKVNSPTYGIVISDQAGQKIFASNNLWQNMKSKTLSAGQKQEVIWEIPNVLNTGEYNVSPAIADTYGKETYDWADSLISFKVRKKQPSSAIINLEHAITIVEAKK